MARKKIPENWEDIDIKNMRLPKSKKHGRRRKQKKPQPELAAALATAVLNHCQNKEVRNEKPVRKSKKKKKKPRHYQSYNKWCAEHDDWIVERKPVFTDHAKQRLAEGRSGEFVTSKRGNAVVVITVLPQAEGPRKPLNNIRIKENRKNKLFKYKIR
tara:strand:+ start:81 stop:551 length:471 start_codon:yes stop_codon:yes gene_type:complete